MSVQKLAGAEVRLCLEQAGAFWIYQGEPRADAPHALLTSVKHSDGYVNVGQVLKERPDVRMVFAIGIIATLYEVLTWPFSRVVGADTSSTDLAGDIAQIAGAGHIRMVKTENAQGKSQVWDAGNAPLRDGEKILHVEELITTSSSALWVRDGIRRASPSAKADFVPYLPVVVERSDPDSRVTMVESSRILPLLQLCIRNYDPNPTSCPYCAAGSQAIRPKEGDNWRRLTEK